MFHIFNRIVDIVTNFSLLGPRRIGFYRNRISTGNQNHHSVSGSPEPDFLKIRFRSGRTGFQNLTGFRPDFIIWLDYYRISKFSQIPTGFQNSARYLPESTRLRSLVLYCKKGNKKDCHRSLSQATSCQSRSHASEERYFSLSPLR